jgi:hypothetical protein
METVILDQSIVAPAPGLDEYLAKLQAAPDLDDSAGWGDLVASLRYTHELARLARALV